MAWKFLHKWLATGNFSFSLPEGQPAGGSCGLQLTLYKRIRCSAWKVGEINFIPRIVEIIFYILFFILVLCRFQSEGGKGRWKAVEHIFMETVYLSLSWLPGTLPVWDDHIHIYSVPHQGAHVPQWRWLICGINTYDKTHFIAVNKQRCFYFLCQLNTQAFYFEQ